MQAFICLNACIYGNIFVSLQCNKEENNNNNKNNEIMKTLNFKSEADTEKKVLELTSKGANFRVIGRKTIVTF